MKVHDLRHGAEPRHGAARLALLVLIVAALCAACASSPLDEPSEQGRDEANNDAPPGNNGLPDEANNDSPVAPFVPAPAVMPRLTADQYRNSLVAIFGEPLPATPVEADTNPYLFYNIGATTTEVSAHGVELYAEAGFSVARAIFADPARRDALVGCAPTSADDPCVGAFIERFGRRLLRRPLTGEEVARWREVVRQIGDEDVQVGLELMVAGLLQSPHFLYRVELGEPDPADPSRRRYTSFEMAQRLAFLFWNAGPDEALLDAAARGELLDDVTLYEQAARLSADPRARKAVQDFFAQYLDLVRLRRVERDPARYPGYSEALLASMETELRLLVDDVVYRQDGDIRQLFSAPRGFVNSELAALYDIDVPEATPVTFVPVEFPPESPRAGILSLGAFLTMNAHPTETSPTLRGKYLRERVLCQTVPPPPDNVDLNLDNQDGGGATLRERLEQHRNDPACAGCHSYVDPPGFLFEHFDSVGRYREEAEGYPIDASGNLDGTPLSNARDLAGMLRDDERVPDCMVLQLYRHANGRLETRGEAAALDDLERSFAASGYRFQELMLALALSEGFRTVANEETMP